MKKIYLFLALFSLLFWCYGGCGGSSDGVVFFSSSGYDCDDEIAELVAVHGDPEEIDYYDRSDGYHCWDYWYWCEGLCYTVTWWEGVSCCEVSLYRFDPICGTWETGLKTFHRKSWMIEKDRR